MDRSDFEQNYDLVASYENKLTCPHCGWKDQDSWERGDEGYTVCELCGNEFYFTTEVERTFFSYKMKEGRKDDGNQER